MHASLPDVKYRPPLWWSIVIGCLCLHSKALLVLSMHWLIHVLVIHSVVSAVHIRGCLWRLLLLLFIKLDSAPKCGVAWFIMKDFLSWILLKIIFRLVVCLMPTPIKIVNQSWTCPQLKQYSSSICYHQSSLKLSNHPDMHLIACSTKAHGCMLSVILNRFPLALLIGLWKEMQWHHQWCSFYHPYSCDEVRLRASRWSHSQSWWVHPSNIHSNTTMR